MGISTLNGHHSAWPVGDFELEAGAGSFAPGDAATARREGRRILAEESHVNIFCDTLEQLVLADTFTVTDYRVLLGLLVYCERGNYVHLSAAELARRLQMPYGSCLKSWHVMLDGGWLRPVYNAYGRVESYRLSPYLCWRGRPWKARMVQRQWDSEARLMRLSGDEEG